MHRPINRSGGGTSRASKTVTKRETPLKDTRNRLEEYLRFFCWWTCTRQSGMGVPARALSRFFTPPSSPTLMPRDEPTPTVVTHTLGNLALAGEVISRLTMQGPDSAPMTLPLASHPRKGMIGEVSDTLLLSWFFDAPGTFDLLGAH